MVERCARKGFDAVEFDNLDSWTRFDDEGSDAPELPFDKADAIDYAELLTDHAHAQHLAVGQKNTPQLGRRNSLDVIGFDFAIAEQCSTISRACHEPDPRRTGRRDIHRLRVRCEDGAGMRHVHGPTLAALQYDDLPGSHDYDLSGCRTRQVRGLPRPLRVRDAHSDLRVPINSFTARIGTAGG